MSANAVITVSICPDETFSLSASRVRLPGISLSSQVDVNKKADLDIVNRDFTTTVQSVECTRFRPDRKLMLLMPMQQW
jgi:hypothetical protein